jgi:hypothetical protein
MHGGRVDGGDALKERLFSVSCTVGMRTGAYNWVRATCTTLFEPVALIVLKNSLSHNSMRLFASLTGV